MRKLALLGAFVVAIVAIAAPASATPPDPESDLVDGHKIWICHATRSLSNPYVKILIDVAAWSDAEDPDDPNDHGLHHTRTKEGVTWSDYALDDPADECVLDPPPPPPGLRCPSGDVVDQVIYFDGSKLVDNDPLQTVSVTVEAGTYGVILGSSDDPRGPNVQPNEQWRANFDGEVTGFSADLPDTGVAEENSTYVGSIELTSSVDEVTAEHWEYVNGPAPTANSVVPEYICLTERNGVRG
jgi:hypothetical protein